jgi:uridine kinase
MSKTKVVAISGTSGCGKTTIVRKLAKRLNCTYLHFDDYVENNTYPTDMKKWLNDGANVSAIETPKMTTAIQTLLKKSTSGFIFIEEPFGTERAPMNAYIDYVVLLNTPMEICLARIVNRSMNNPQADPLKSLPLYLAKYQDYYRDCYIEAVNQVHNNCDLIIEGGLSINQTVDVICDWLKSA